MRLPPLLLFPVQLIPEGGLPVFGDTPAPVMPTCKCSSVCVFNIQVCHHLRIATARVFGAAMRAVMVWHQMSAAAVLPALSCALVLLFDSLSLAPVLSRRDLLPSAPLYPSAIAATGQEPVCRVYTDMGVVVALPHCMDNVMQCRTDPFLNAIGKACICKSQYSSRGLSSCSCISYLRTVFHYALCAIKTSRASWSLVLVVPTAKTECPVLFFLQTETDGVSSLGSTAADPRFVPQYPQYLDKKGNGALGPMTQV